MADDKTNTGEKVANFTAEQVKQIGEIVKTAITSTKPEGATGTKTALDADLLNDIALKVKKMELEKEAASADAETSKDKKEVDYKKQYEELLEKSKLTDPNFDIEADPNAGILNQDEGPGEDGDKPTTPKEDAFFKGANYK